MKKFTVALFALALMAVSCQEFQPVFTTKYDTPAVEEQVTDQYVLSKFGLDHFTSIKDLKALYTTHESPVEIQDLIVIRGEVTSSDEDGNVYRELYLQDASGAIDLKIGRSSSYDDYKLGQILYVNCQGLTLAEYGFKDRKYNGCGQLSLGLKRNMVLNLDTGEMEEADDYENSYIDLEPVLRAKVFKGVILPENERIQPKADVKGSDIAWSEYEETSAGAASTVFQTLINHDLVGLLVEMKDLKYDNEVFGLFYPNPNLNHTSDDPKNRIFISKPDSNECWDAYDYTYGIKWWALTKHRFGVMIENAREMAPTVKFKQYPEIFTDDFVTLLKQAGITDVCELFISSPKAISDLKISGLTAAMVQKAVEDVFAAMDEETRIRMEWFCLEVGSGSDKFGNMGKTLTDEAIFGVSVPYIDLVRVYPSAQSISHYFIYQNEPIAIRTSGYARFADIEIPEAVRSGEQNIDVIGILSRYQGGPQLTILKAWLSGDSTKKSILSL